MADDLGFADRLAYVRWLRQAGRTEVESLRAFSAAIGVEYAWLHKWADSARAPTRRPEIKALMAGLAPMGITEEWLIDGTGTPPMPTLWRGVWIKARGEIPFYFGGDVKTTAKPAKKASSE